MIQEIKVDALIQDELEEASDKYGVRHHSAHENYAVLLEEFEEAQDDFDSAMLSLARYWHSVKDDDRDTQKECLRAIYRTVVRCIRELVQVAAMAVKGLR